MEFCTNCGKPLKEGAVFCSSCGAKRKATGDGTKREAQNKKMEPRQMDSQEKTENPAEGKMKKAAGGKNKGLKIAIPVLVIAAAAITGCVVYLNSDSHHYRKYMKLADASYAQKDYEAAAELYLEAGEYGNRTKTEEKLTAVYTDWGNELLAQGKYERAIKTHKQVSEYGVKKAAAELIKQDYLAWGQSYWESGDYEDALEIHKAAEEYCDEGTVNALITEDYTAWGNALMDKGNYEEAMEIHQRALEYADQKTVDSLIMQDKIRWGDDLLASGYYRDGIRKHQELAEYEDEDLVEGLLTKDYILWSDDFLREDAIQEAVSVLKEGEEWYGYEGIRKRQEEILSEIDALLVTEYYDGSEISRTSYEYDEEGNIIARETHFSISDKRETAYDVESDTLYSASLDWFRIEYDTEGHIAGESWNYQGGYSTSTRYQYDSAGNIIEEESGQSKIKYEYNADNELIAEEHLEADILISRVEYSYTYVEEMMEKIRHQTYSVGDSDDAGMVMIYDYGAQGGYTEYAAAEEGLSEEESMMAMYGSSMYGTSTSYDALGRIIREENYDEYIYINYNSDARNPESVNWGGFRAGEGGYGIDITYIYDSSGELELVNYNKPGNGGSGSYAVTHTYDYQLSDGAKERLLKASEEYYRKEVQNKEMTGKQDAEVMQSSEMDEYATMQSSVPASEKASMESSTAASSSASISSDAVSKAPSQEEEEYILPDSSTRKLTMADLEGLSKEEARIARNEIFARHGRKFSDEELQDYFESLSWYNGTIEPADFKDDVLSEIEVHNRDLIVEYETKNGYR